MAYEDLINKALQNISNANTQMQTELKNEINKPAPDYFNAMRQSQQNLMQQTGYNDLMKTYTNMLSEYTKKVANAPLLTTLQQKYIKETPTEDVDTMIDRYMQMRDSVFERLQNLETKQGTTIDPYKLYSLAKNMQSFYDNQIKELTRIKEDRIKAAKEAAQMEYQDRIQNLSRLTSTIQNLKSMLDLTWRQVQEGQVDSRTAIRLQQEYDKQQAQLRKQLIDTQQKYGLTQLQVLQAIQNIQSQELKNKVYQQQLQENDPELNQLKKAYNLKTTQVVGKTNDGLPIFNPVYQGGKRYFDVTGKIDDGKHITAIANNPGSITYNGKNGEYLKQLGAIGVVKSPNGRMYAVFPDEETGRKALIANLTSNQYKDLSVADAIRKRVGPNEPATALKYIDKELQNKIIGKLDNNELQQIAQAIEKAELGGFKPETYNPLGTKEGNLKPTNVIKAVEKIFKKPEIKLSELMQTLKQANDVIADMPSTEQYTTKINILGKTLPKIMTSQVVLTSIVKALNQSTDKSGKPLLQVILENNKDVLDDYIDYGLGDISAPFSGKNNYDIDNITNIIDGIRNNPDFREKLASIINRTIVKSLSPSNKKLVDNLWNGLVFNQ